MYTVLSPPTGPPSLWFKCLPSKSRWLAVQIPDFRNLVNELTTAHVGTGSAWKLYTCCAATLVSGTRVAPGLHPGMPTGRKSFHCALSPRLHVGPIRSGQVFISDCSHMSKSTASRSVMLSQLWGQVVYIAHMNVRHSAVCCAVNMLGILMFS